MASSNLKAVTLDEQQFAEMRELLQEDFKALLLDFITDSQARVQSLHLAANDADNANGFEIAHTLKGASASLGAVHFGQLCAQLQEACRRQSISDSQSLIEQLSDELILLEKHIHQRLGQ